MGEVGMSAEIS